MQELVTLKSTAVGYTLLIGGKVVKTGLPSISSAKIWMRKNYGRKFDESTKSLPWEKGTFIGLKNPTSERAAKLAAPPKMYQPVVVRLPDGSYDAFQRGHPLPIGAVIVARQDSRTGKWKRANMSQGITRGTGQARVFHPIRSAPDYDPTLLSGAEGKKARSGKASAAKKRSAAKRSGLKAIKTKSTVKAKTATKRRKAKRAVSLFGKKALPTSRRNPKGSLNAAREHLYDGPRTEIIAIAKELRRLKLTPIRVVHNAGAGYTHRPSSIYVAKMNIDYARDIRDRVINGTSRHHGTRNPSKKRSIPAAFKAAAQRAKAMTPVQRSAWAKKMQAARKAKAKLKR